MRTPGALAEQCELIMIGIGTFITVTGPPGSGKADLINRVIADKGK